jgi:hypothetical protein
MGLLIVAARVLLVFIVVVVRMLPLRLSLLLSAHACSA